MYCLWVPEEESAAGFYRVAGPAWPEDWGEGTPVDDFGAIFRRFAPRLFLRFLSLLRRFSSLFRHFYSSTLVESRGRYWPGSSEHTCTPPTAT